MVGPTVSTRVYFTIDRLENILVPRVFSISNGGADDWFVCKEKKEGSWKQERWLK